MFKLSLIQSFPKLRLTKHHVGGPDMIFTVFVTSGKKKKNIKIMLQKEAGVDQGAVHINSAINQRI